MPSGKRSPAVSALERGLFRDVRADVLGGCYLRCSSADNDFGHRPRRSCAFARYLRKALPRKRYLHFRKARVLGETKIGRLAIYWQSASDKPVHFDRLPIVEGKQ